MTTPDEFFARYPRAAERLNARLAEYFGTLTPEQQVELETADTALAFRETADGLWRLEVTFKLPAGAATLFKIDAASIGVHIIDGEVVYIDDEGHA